MCQSIKVAWMSRTRSSIKRRKNKKLQRPIANHKWKVPWYFVESDRSQKGNYCDERLVNASWWRA